MAFLSDPAFSELSEGTDSLDCVILDPAMPGNPLEWKVRGISSAAVRAAFARLFQLCPWQRGRLHVRLTPSIDARSPTWSILAITPGTRARIRLSGSATARRNMVMPAEPGTVQVLVAEPVLPRDAFIQALIHWLAPFHPAFEPPEVVFDEEWLLRVHAGSTSAARGFCVRANDLAELDSTVRKAASFARLAHATIGCSVLVAPPSVRADQALRRLDRIGMSTADSSTYALLRGHQSAGYWLSLVVLEDGD